MSNPKDQYGQAKLPLHLWPPTATAMGSIAMLNGALKYGQVNFRATPVYASVYIAGLLRHTYAYLEGQELDNDGVPHLAAMLANVAIIVDAQAAGTLVDDRPIHGGYFELEQSLLSYVSALKEKHKDKNPYQYTRNNTEGSEQ